MRTIEKTVYDFSELSEKAKEKAMDKWFSSGFEYAWIDESIDSVKAFCDAFGITITDWQLGEHCHSYISTDATPDNFRGVKLSEIDREQMPTGYCLDNDLWYTFHDVFKATGSAWVAFKQAIEAAVSAIIADMESQTSEEYLEDFFDANGFEFYEDGTIA